MNYKKVYDSIIRKAVLSCRSKKVGLERHHIIPRCMGGEDKEENLVYLTCREHYIAHKLLAKAYLGTKWYGKLIGGVWLMSNVTSKSKVCRNSKEYKNIRESFLNEVTYVLNVNNSPPTNIFQITNLKNKVNYVDNFIKGWNPPNISFENKIKFLGCRRPSMKVLGMYSISRVLHKLGYEGIAYTKKDIACFRGTNYCSLEKVTSKSKKRTYYMKFTEDFKKHADGHKVQLPLNNFRQCIHNTVEPLPRIRIIKSVITKWNKENPLKLLSVFTSKGGVYLHQTNNWDAPVELRNLLYKYTDSYTMYEILHEDNILGVANNTKKNLLL